MEKKETIKIEILITYEMEDLQKLFTPVEFVERIVLFDGEELYRDRSKWHIYKNLDDPLKNITDGLFHKSNGSNNHTAKRNNKIGFFKMFWRKLFCK